MSSDDGERYIAVLEALDEASGGDIPRHWSTWRHVIAAAVCAAVEWRPASPPPPHCPGCGVLSVDIHERVDVFRAAVPGERGHYRVTWMCCGLVRDYATLTAYARRYEPLP